MTQPPYPISLPHHPVIRGRVTKSSRLKCRLLRSHSWVLALWSFPDATLICVNCATYTLVRYPRTAGPSDTLADEDLTATSQAIEH